MADRAPARRSWPPPRRSTPSTSSTRWGTCDRRPDRHGRRGSTELGVDGRPGPARQGRADRAPLRLRRHARTRSTRSGAATSTARCASRRRPRRPTATRASSASGASSRRSTAPTCRTPTAIAVCDDPSVLGRTFYLMGFVDGWSPMDLTDGVAGAVRHRPRGARRASPTSWSRASRCCRRSTGRPRACRTSAGPTASTSARSTAGPRSSSASRAASCPASTRRRRGCAPTSRSTSSPGSCTATTSSPT